MSKGYQTVAYRLPDVTWTAGGTATQVLRDLPKQIMGRLVHLAAITWEVDVDATYTAVPTTIGINNAVTNMRISDGSNILFEGGFNYLRIFEILENRGQLVHPDPDVTTSTNNGYYARTWFAGPPRFAGSPADFLLAAAGLENGQIDYTFGALTDFSSDTTAATVAIRATAHLVLLDEIRVSPVYERRSWTAGAADINLTGRALYPYMAMLNSSAVDAIGSGDFGALSVDTGQGNLINAVDAEILTRMFHAENLTGHFTPVQGEPRAATDDNPKVVNYATPTALAAATASIQPVLWCPDSCRISKVVAEADSVLRLRWNGSQATGVILTSRILEQSEPTVGAKLGKALGRLSLRPNGNASKIKTLEKGQYRGPRVAYMPYTFKVA